MTIKKVSLVLTVTCPKEKLKGSEQLKLKPSVQSNQEWMAKIILTQTF